jgi:excisionase family DNA binding protein
MQQERLLYSKTEAVQMLGLSLRTIDTLISRGELRARRIGPKRVMIPRSELERFANGEQDAIQHETASVSG